MKVALPQYDVNYKIMQWKYDKSKACHDDDGGCVEKTKKEKVSHRRG